MERRAFGELATRTAMTPLGNCSIEQSANCDDPPPDGSTARTTWNSLYESIRNIGSFFTSIRGRFKKLSTSADGNALLEPSADNPIDSRSLRHKERVRVLNKNAGKGIGAYQHRLRLMHTKTVQSRKYSRVQS